MVPMNRPVPTDCAFLPHHTPDPKRVNTTLLAIGWQLFPYETTEGWLYCPPGERPHISTALSEIQAISKIRAGLQLATP